MARIHAKDAFMRVEPDIIASIAKENLGEVFWVVLPPSLVSWQIIQIRLNDMAYVMECVRHSTLEGSSSIL